MVNLIQRLTEKGFTYTSDGSTYFPHLEIPFVRQAFQN
jgi:cysteinyl-tRNA synthetase